MSIKHTARLPHGYEVEFSWAPGAINVAWSPDLPEIRSRRAFNKLLRAYQVERSTFLRMVATSAVHESILIADTNGDMEFVRPAARH